MPQAQRCAAQANTLAQHATRGAKQRVGVVPVPVAVVGFVLVPVVVVVVSRTVKNQTKIIN